MKAKLAIRLLAALTFSSIGCSSSPHQIGGFGLGTWDDINSAAVASTASGSHPTLIIHMRGYLDGTITPNGIAFTATGAYPDTHFLQNLLLGTPDWGKVWSALTIQQGPLTQAIQPATFYTAMKMLAPDQTAFQSGPPPAYWEIDVNCDTYRPTGQTEYHQTYVDVIYRQPLKVATRDELANLIEFDQTGTAPVQPIDYSHFAEIVDPGVRLILKLP